MLINTSLHFCRLNALVLGGGSGFIEIYAYGMFKIATVTGVGSIPFHHFFFLIYQTAAELNEKIPVLLLTLKQNRIPEF